MLFEIRYTEETSNKNVVPTLRTIQTRNKIEAFATAQSLAYEHFKYNAKYSVSVYQYGPRGNAVKIATITKFGANI